MRRLSKIILVVVLLGIVAYSAFQVGSFWTQRIHGTVDAQTMEFTESSKKLINPNRGFYKLFGVILKEEQEDYVTFVKQRINDSDEVMYLVQINLCRFKEKAISEKALENLNSLFSALKLMDKQYIIRFLYDWDGNGLDAEPESIDIILTHMQQLEEIFKTYDDIIFIHQGIFVGNYGEMHNSKYLSTESIQTLLGQLSGVTGEATFLAVRTPTQWRKATQITDLYNENYADSLLASRLSLYNDGMMGTEQDCGTYGVLSKVDAGLLEAWNREEELEFQNELCQRVPNGGEVIISNEVNDFENAVESLASMHVTYLNSAYDPNVLNKWAETIVQDESCYSGMDGLSYIERHLGYRILIENCTMNYDFWKDTLSVNVALKNVGFAPLYRQPDIYLSLYSEENEICYTYGLTGDVCSLAGGNDAEQTLNIQKDVLISGFEEGEYNVAFYMIDPYSGCHIEFAIEQDEGEYGYPIGKVKIESKDNFKELLYQECKKKLSQMF